MSFIDTKGKFHVALDGVGLLLQGAPNAPAYRSTNAPVYGTRFASGDRDYNDLSQWWYLIQTDWSGGIKDNISFADDAKFYYSSNIDTRTKPGTIRLERDVELVFDNAANTDEIMAVVTSTQLGNARTHFIDNSESRTLGGASAWDSGGDPYTEVGIGDYLWRFGEDVENSNTALPYPFVGTDKTSQINSIIDGSVDECVGLVVGSALYVVGISTTNKLFYVKTTVANPASSADWTLVAEIAYGDSFGAHFAGAANLGGEIVALTSAQPYWHLHSLDIASGVINVLRRFPGGQQLGIYQCGGRYVMPFNDGILITICTGGTDDEYGEIWFYNGSTLSKIFTSDEAKQDFSTREATTWLRGGAVVHGEYAYWGNLVYDGTDFFNFIKAISDDPDEVAIPVGTDGDYLYVVDNVLTGSDPQSQLYRYNPRGSIYKEGADNSAFLVFSQHDNLQSIDKLLNAITIGFEEFLADQIIRVYYSTAPIPDPNLTTGEWILLGTASHALDGASATFKTFPFPVGTTAKKVWFRVELEGDGTNTPGMTDFTLEYLPMPDYKKQWTLNINCADEVKRLDGGLVETTARELKSRLEKMWWTKSALDYEDLDYATTLVNDASFVAADTTITVDSTADFPEQGRLKIEDEEILYTGKTPTTFTGCTRGARGTRASDHADNAVVNNAYRVIVTDVDIRTPILNEDKDLEYIVGISLREV